MCSRLKTFLRLAAGPQSTKHYPAWFVEKSFVGWVVDSTITQKSAHDWDRFLQHQVQLLVLSLAEPTAKFKSQEHGPLML